MGSDVSRMVVVTVDCTELVEGIIVIIGVGSSITENKKLMYI